MPKTGNLQHPHVILDENQTCIKLVQGISKTALQGLLRVPAQVYFNYKTV